MSEQNEPNERQVEIATAEMLLTAFGGRDSYGLREALLLGVAIGEGRANEVLPPALLAKNQGKAAAWSAQERVRAPMRNETLGFFHPGAIGGGGTLFG